MLSKILLAALAVLCLLQAPATAQTGTYLITDLGTLPGDTVSEASALNNRGEVVGWSGNAMRTHAFLYRNGMMIDISPGHATGINDAGQVIGDGPGRAFIYSGGALTVINTPNSSLSRAHGLNNSGQVVGDYGDFEASIGAFLYSEGAINYLSPLNMLRFSSARDINNSGQIVGGATIAIGNDYAFLYRDGVVTQIVAQGSACCINDLGQIAGTYQRGSAFSAFFYSNGRLTDLGALPGDNSSGAYGLNLHGQVVGSSSLPVYPNPTRAFLYSEGAMHDLNDLIPPGSGWVLERAYGINDCGQIVGSGTLNGRKRAFLLTPRAAPPQPTGPVLLTEGCSEQAIALDSVTFMRDPFPVVATYNFGADRHTRIMLFARNVELMPGEDLRALTVRAEAGQQRAFALPVEFVGPVPNVEGLTQVNVRLTDELLNVSEVRVSLSLRGVSSNKALIRIRQRP